MYMVLSLLCKTCFDTNWIDYLPKSALMVPAIAVQNVLFFMLVWGFPSGYMVSSLVNKSNPAKVK